MDDSTVVQKKKVAEGVRALGVLARKYARKILDRFFGRLNHLSRGGRIIAVIALAVAAICAVGIIFDASDVALEKGAYAVVTGKTVNVRKSPSTKSRVLEQVSKGDRLQVAGADDGWVNVRAADGAWEGWIASSLVSRKTDTTLVYRYDMKGYVLFLLGAVAVFLVALRLKAE